MAKCLNKIALFFSFKVAVSIASKFWLLLFLQIKIKKTTRKLPSQSFKGNDFNVMRVIACKSVRLYTVVNVIKIVILHRMISLKRDEETLSK